MPDSAESRIGRLETAVAKLEQRVDNDHADIKDNTADIKALAPLAVTVAEIRLGLSRLEKLYEGAAEREEHRAVREQQTREAQLKDSRNWRRALVLGSFTVLAAIITAAGAIIEGVQ